MTLQCKSLDVKKNKNPAERITKEKTHTRKVRAYSCRVSLFPCAIAKGEEVAVLSSAPIPVIKPVHDGHDTRYGKLTS